MFYFWVLKQNQSWMWSEVCSLQRGRGGNLAVRHIWKKVTVIWGAVGWFCCDLQCGLSFRLKTEVLSSSTHTLLNVSFEVQCSGRTNVLKYYQQSDCFEKLPNFKETILVKYMFPLFNMNNKLALKLIPLILNTVCGYSFAESISLFIATNLNMHMHYSPLSQQSVE